MTPQEAANVEWLIARAQSADAEIARLRAFEPDPQAQATAAKLQALRDADEGGGGQQPRPVQPASAAQPAQPQQSAPVIDIQLPGEAATQ